jgi:hypothetical protein
MGLLDGPLRSRNFRPLLACKVISVTGTAVAMVAVPFAVLATGWPGQRCGVVQAAGLIPMAGSCCWVAWPPAGCPVIGSGGRLDMCLRLEPGKGRDFPVARPASPTKT